MPPWAHYTLHQWAHAILSRVESVPAAIDMVEGMIEESVAAARHHWLSVKEYIERNGESLMAHREMVKADEA